MIIATVRKWLGGFVLIENGLLNNVHLDNGMGTAFGAFDRKVLENGAPVEKVIPIDYRALELVQRQYRLMIVHVVVEFRVEETIAEAGLAHATVTGECLASTSAETHHARHELCVSFSSHYLNIVRQLNSEGKQNDSSLSR